MIPFITLVHPLLFPLYPMSRPKSGDGGHASCSDMGRTIPTSICKGLQVTIDSCLVNINFVSHRIQEHKVWTNNLILQSKISFLSSPLLLVLLCPFFFCTFPLFLPSFLPSSLHPPLPPSLSSFLPSLIPSSLNSFLPPSLLSFSFLHRLQSR